ncbi:MAG: ABC transporter permease [Chitinophagaceae bacterium]|jgi:putative ABC transport system permease protein
MSAFYLTALQMALCLGPMAMGIFITMKVFNIPDITTDGSYTLGATVTAVLLTSSVPVWIALPLSIMAGALAGTFTGLIHTKLGIDALLSGILVMTAMYSVNLMILGRSNIPLIDIDSIFNKLPFSPIEQYNELLVAFLFVAVLLSLIIYLLRTDFGIAMRATGNNPIMTKAMGVNNDRIKIIGLAMSNGLTATSGFLVAQYQGFTDINMGIGIVITGLGSVLIADAIRTWTGIRKIGRQIMLVVVGCIVFQAVLAFTLSIGIDPNLLKMVTALFVLFIVALPRISKSFAKK